MSPNELIEMVKEFLISKHCQMLRVPDVISDDKEREAFARWYLTFTQDLYDFAQEEGGGQ